MDYRNELNRLSQYEKEARDRLEKDLQEQKKKDMEELTKVFKSREAALDKNFSPTNRCRVDSVSTLANPLVPSGLTNRTCIITPT